ncbi:hypothetical protein [Nonomuraea wenchangensis]|uniref:Uncharacterized protein n=1 Tax=Nonomuraea wenchangensis TaxID=568860 RepID=A0A1I0LW79_9ACTN|nr:hypothetical protein [Nonomuraea wenchangensis]SEU46474.1 hypothetical protein SAMN05421811_12743 [Nonomuraea wenchangensis]
MTSTNPTAFEISEDLRAAVRAALADLNRALEGHTGNNPMLNAYRLPAARATLAEVIAIVDNDGTLYTGPTPTAFAAMDKVSEADRASWYVMPDRAGAAARIAATCEAYGIPADHLIATHAPSHAEIKAMVGSADPLAKMTEIHAEAAKREQERIKAEREKRIKKAVAAARNLTEYGGDPALPFAKAIESGADRAELAQAFTNAGLPVPPEEPAKAKPAPKK